MRDSRRPRHSRRPGSAPSWHSWLCNALVTALALALLARQFAYRSSPQQRRLRSEAAHRANLSILEKEQDRLSRVEQQSVEHHLGGGSTAMQQAGEVSSAQEMNASVHLHGTGQDGLGKTNEDISGRSTDGTNMSSDEDYALLHNGVKMPRVGFGTAGLGPLTQQATAAALAAGYRLIDSAQAREWYREDLVGAALAEAGVSRSDLFLVSKLHPRHLGHALTLERFGDSLRDLGTDYLDLFLLHYPTCFPAICGTLQPAGTWRESWQALEELHRDGRIRAIGVSNFSEEELRELLRVATVRPHVLQRNSDPLRADRGMQALCRAEGVAYMGYSSLGSQWQATTRGANPVLSHRRVRSLAQARGCSPAQVVLKWALANGQIVIPRSANRQHMEDNRRASSCPLSPQDVVVLDSLDGTDPDNA